MVIANGFCLSSWLWLICLMWLFSDGPVEKDSEMRVAVAVKGAGLCHDCKLEKGLVASMLN